MTSSNYKLFKNYVSIHWHYPAEQVTKSVLWCILYVWIHLKINFGGGIWVSPQSAVTNQRACSTWHSILTVFVGILSVQIRIWIYEYVYNLVCMLYECMLFNVLLQNRILFDNLVSNVKNASCFLEKMTGPIPTFFSKYACLLAKDTEFVPVTIITEQIL